MQQRRKKIKIIPALIICHEKIQLKSDKTNVASKKCAPIFVSVRIMERNNVLLFLSLDKMRKSHYGYFLTLTYDFSFFFFLVLFYSSSLNSPLSFLSVYSTFTSLPLLLRHLLLLLCFWNVLFFFSFFFLFFFFLFCLSTLFASDFIASFLFIFCLFFIIYFLFFFSLSIFMCLFT